MFVYKVSTSVILVLQLVVNGQENCCTDGDFRQQPWEKSNGIFIQYCSGGSWHYLCGEGVGWTPTLGTVVCRQLGYSDQGASFSISFHCNDLPHGNVTAFRTNQPCNGTETSLIECGGLHRVAGICYCGEVAEIMCQPTVTQGGETTTTMTTEYMQSTIPTTQHRVSSTHTTESDITPFRDSKATLASTSKECDTSITTTLGSVIGVLVALQVGTLITLCVVVVYWKHSVKSKQSLSDPSTKRNESYSLHQMKKHGYVDEPNTSMGPTYDVVANVDEQLHTYDVIVQSN